MLIPVWVVIVVIVLLLAFAHATYVYAKYTAKKIDQLANDLDLMRREQAREWEHARERDLT